MIQFNQTLSVRVLPVIITPGGAVIPIEPISLSRIPEQHRVPVLLAAFLTIGSFFAVTRLRPITTGAAALILGTTLAVQIMEEMFKVRECAIAVAREQFYQNGSICILPAIKKAFSTPTPMFAKFVKTQRCAADGQEEWGLCFCQDRPGNSTFCGSSIQEKWEEKTREQIYKEVILPKCGGPYSGSLF